eukprot:CAMPEP_0195294354 /NCGR_PEP_ID=MMETSP0707-20130614/14738_1 /TAXON_ID=33640 /ORGANISM="Asterionellopsis glacialis, Strain CCMP134" /LENGTH=490 /DNA_ID=CAMNT_0040355299 /DNA_START=22 /DNA_END=1494 /DNA_ORIENTATION=+
MMMLGRSIVLFFLLLLLTSISIVSSDEDAESPSAPSYGVDVSTPIHHAKVSDNYAWLPHNVDPSNHATPAKYKDMAIQPLGNMQELYDQTIQGCVDYYGKKGSRCYMNEQERIEMSLRQPQSMQNYTDLGFKKIRAPPELFSLIQQFWKKHKNNWKQSNREENWPAGNTYTNHWQAMTYITSIEDPKLRGGGHRLKQQIWDAAQDTLEEWTGEELTQCSLYGIRTYTTGAILASHVDRLPLVSSAIINVDQDVDEPWPLEVIGHDGKAHNVTMEIGDMVLYESHSIIHGRPFPLKGKFFSNVFVHFEPTGHSLRHNAKMDAQEAATGDVHHEYEKAIARGLGGHEATHDTDTTGLPAYVIPGTPEEVNWRRQHPDNKRSNRRSSVTGSTDLHQMAQQGDLQGLQKVLKKKDKRHAEVQDMNGWRPIHEAARGGHVDIVSYLFGLGVDINARTDEGDGGTALYYAQESLGKNHPVVKFLKAQGAEYVEPEL